jgi:hypothetical protein
VAPESKQDKLERIWLRINNKLQEITIREEEALIPFLMKRQTKVKESETASNRNAKKPMKN